GARPGGQDHVGRSRGPRQRARLPRQYGPPPRGARHRRRPAAPAARAGRGSGAAELTGRLDEVMVYRLWDLFKDVAIWSSDYPHHDAEDAWKRLSLGSG